MPQFEAETMNHLGNSKHLQSYSFMGFGRFHYRGVDVGTVIAKLRYAGLAWHDFVFVVLYLGEYFVCARVAKQCSSI